MVQMKQVTSSHVQSIGHDAGAQELHVEYKNGARFVYKDVPADKAQQVINSHSIGKALNSLVKGQHDHEQI